MGFISKRRNYLVNGLKFHCYIVFIILLLTPFFIPSIQIAIQFWTLINQLTDVVPDWRKGFYFVFFSMCYNTLFRIILISNAGRIRDVCISRLWWIVCQVYSSFGQKELTSFYSILNFDRIRNRMWIWCQPPLWFKLVYDFTKHLPTSLIYFKPKFIELVRKIVIYAT